MVQSPSMQNLFHALQKGLRIIVRRFRTQGVRTTLLWFYGRGLPMVTGVPLIQYCKVTPQLYVGSQFNQLGKRMLVREGITGCVNMRIEKDDAASGLALKQYLYLPTIDDEAPKTEHLDQGVAFIQELVANGGKVYIHCGAGVGRAPTMAAAYLIAEGKTMDEALALIRKVRPFITITPPQMEALNRYEARFQAQRLQNQIEKQATGEQ